MLFTSPFLEVLAWIWGTLLETLMSEDFTSLFKDTRLYDPGLCISKVLRRKESDIPLPSFAEAKTIASQLVRRANALVASLHTFLQICLFIVLPHSVENG